MGLGKDPTPTPTSRGRQDPGGRAAPGADAVVPLAGHLGGFPMLPFHLEACPQPTPSHRPAHTVQARPGSFQALCVLSTGGAGCPASRAFAHKEALD